MKLVSVGLNHKTAPLEIREKLAFSQEKIPQALKSLLDQHILEEALILSTCNRVEIYGVTPRPEISINQIEQFLSSFHGIPVETLHSHLYSHSGQDSVLHGYRVASSLDSMVLGESQILGQMKDAYELATESGTVGSILNRYLHRVFNVAKKIRTETEISSGPVSVSYMAVMLAKKIFGDLKGRKALLLGAGKMGQIASKHLKGQGIAEIWVANRSFEKAKEIALACDGKPLFFDDFYFSLPMVDVVIASTASENYLIKAEHIHKTMKLRKNSPMFIIDIAVPRNVDPEINNIYNVYLYDLDDLQSLVENNQKERSQEALKGESIALQEAKRFVQEIEKLSITPTIHLLSTKFEKIRQQELLKALSKLKNLAPEQQAILEAMSSSIINKILHDPLLALKTQDLEKGDRATSYLELIQKLFRLDEI